MMAKVTAKRAPLAALIERHGSEMLAYLVRLVGDRADAEDACQDAFLRAHRAYARLAPDANGRAWLYRIATNSGLNVVRGRRRRRARTTDVELDRLPARVTALPEQRAELRAVARAVEGLPPRQRAALMLRRFHDLDYADIAASLGGSEEGARANVYQALRKLRAALGRSR
jgi:RNA polymerase sigma-70 factor (ECF subfamily)